MANIVDFLVITALEEERDAVLAHLPSYQKLPPAPQAVNIYYKAELPVMFAGGVTASYDVVVAPLVTMGHVDATLVTSEAIRRWQPSFVLLVGIAAGIPENGVALGDVLVPDQIVDYEPQKLTPTGSDVRWQPHRADRRLLGAAQNFRDDAWMSSVAPKRPTNGQPRRHIGPILSGNKVIANAAVVNQYRSVWSKLIGIEMEAGGVAAAAFGSASRPGFFMVRGVSDFADEHKNTVEVAAWRGYASAVAAAYTIALLQSGPVEARPEKTKARSSATQSSATMQGLGERRFASIPMPRIHRSFTQLEKDRFLQEALDEIWAYFEEGVTELKSQRPDVEALLQVHSPTKFTCKMYEHGRVKNECKIWLDGRFRSSVISYHEGDINPTNDSTSNGSLNLEEDGEALYLRNALFSHYGREPSDKLTPTEAAEYLWRRFTKIGYR